MSAVKEILAKGSVEVKAEAKESRNESASRPNIGRQYNSALFANVMEWWVYIWSNDMIVGYIQWMRIDS